MDPHIWEIETGLEFKRIVTVFYVHLNLVTFKNVELNILRESTKGRINLELYRISKKK